MREQIEIQIRDAADRLRGKGLFVSGNDSLSMRVPGTEDALLIAGSDAGLCSISLTDGCLHSLIYRTRADAGAVLIGQTNWSAAIAALGHAPPIMYDEHARHIGVVPPVVAEGDSAGLQTALTGGGNAVFYGPQCIRIGMTRDRVVFNAELFEKCSLAFVLAVTAGQPIKHIPGWVRIVAVRRLKRDQRRAAEAYAAGNIPTGMNAY